MLIVFIYFFLPLASSIKFPHVKLTKGGIFGWFDALGLMKKPFNNKKLFGFRLNSTDPDLSMIIYDIAYNLTIHSLSKTESKAMLLDGDKCSGKTGNSHQFCKLFGDSLDLTTLGITEENVNILLANITGYIPTNLFFIIITSLSVIYYIVQIVLQYKIFKPKGYSDPSIYSCIIFYAGDALIFISAILFLCGFGGIDNFISTLVSLDTVVPRITYSVSTSMLQLFEDAIPTSLNPLFQVSHSILNTAQKYLKDTIDSFINPTTLFLQKMVSSDPNDLGVFPLYNEKIYVIANQLYTEMSLNPNLNGIQRLFLSRDFTDEQKQFNDFYNSELDLSVELNSLDSIFVYFDDVASTFENDVVNFINRTIEGDEENRTIGDFLYDVKDNSVNSYEFLANLHKSTKKKNALWIFLAIVFFFIGIFFMVVPAFLGLIFWMHNKIARCVANTISICPLVWTILMFVLAFLMSGVGFALVAVSNQFEARIDDLISHVIDRTIPSREIQIGPANVTQETNGTYQGILNITSFVFPKPMNNVQKFIKYDDEDGIATALSIDDLIDIERFGDEVGDFVIHLSGDFNLPPDLIASLTDVQNLLKLLMLLPNKVDGFFNWGVPISLATNFLREQIKSKDPSALNGLEHYLTDIDVLTDKMNSQYRIAMKQITEELPKAIEDLTTVLPRFIKIMLTDLGTSVKQLVRNVYPVVDSIQCGVILGPYGLIRNVIFHDLSSTCAYISASGTLMIFGMVIVVTMIWIRRQGMMHVTGREIGFFEFILTCRKKKIANDHSCDSMETDDSNIIYLHDSDFDIGTSYCNSEFDVNSKSYHFENEDFDDCKNWCIDEDEDSGFSPPNVDADDCSLWCINEDNRNNNDGGYTCPPEDDNENFCIIGDEFGDYIPDVKGSKCDPSDFCFNWMLKFDPNGNVYPPSGGFKCDPEDDNDNFCIKQDANGNYVPDDDGFKCDPEDDNDNFVVRLNRDGTIYCDKFGDDHPIKDNINDIGDAFIDPMKEEASESELDTDN